MGAFFDASSLQAPPHPALQGPYKHPAIQGGTRTVTKMVSGVHWQLKVGNTCWDLLQKPGYGNVGRRRGSSGSGGEGWLIQKRTRCIGYEEWTGMWTSATDADIDRWADDFAQFREAPGRSPRWFPGCIGS